MGHVNHQDQDYRQQGESDPGKNPEASIQDLELFRERVLGPNSDPAESSHFHSLNRRVKEEHEEANQSPCEDKLSPSRFQEVGEIEVRFKKSNPRSRDDGCSRA